MLQQKVTIYKLVFYKLEVTNYKLLVISNKLQLTSYMFLVTSYNFTNLKIFQSIFQLTVRLEIP